ncbi:MAG: phage holin family protein [Muribaculaceae bacterium]|nr:phage holin family protein [Muribaculaceae bacterium]
MKENITDELRNIFREGKRWMGLELEYLKFTAAEKFTIVLGMLVVGGVCLFIAVLALILFAFALVEVFRTFLCPALAYTCVGGIFVLLLIVIYLLRNQLIVNPIARFITKLVIDGKEE